MFSEIKSIHWTKPCISFTSLLAIEIPALKFKHKRMDTFIHHQYHKSFDIYMYVVSPVFNHGAEWNASSKRFIKCNTSVKRMHSYLFERQWYLGLELDAQIMYRCTYQYVVQACCNLRELLMIHFRTLINTSMLYFISTLHNFREDDDVT